MNINVLSVCDFTFSLLKQLFQLKKCLCKQTTNLKVSCFVALNRRQDSKIRSW